MVNVIAKTNPPPYYTTLGISFMSTKMPKNEVRVFVTIEIKKLTYTCPNCKNRFEQNTNALLDNNECPKCFARLKPYYLIIQESLEEPINT
jgi:hypothetical protein